MVPYCIKKYVPICSHLWMKEFSTGDPIDADKMDLCPCYSMALNKKPNQPNIAVGHNIIFMRGSSTAQHDKFSLK